MTLQNGTFNNSPFCNNSWVICFIYKDNVGKFVITKSVPAVDLTQCYLYYVKIMLNLSGIILSACVHELFLVYRLIWCIVYYYPKINAPCITIEIADSGINPFTCDDAVRSMWRDHHCCNIHSAPSIKCRQYWTVIHHTMRCIVHEIKCGFSQHWNMENLGYGLAMVIYMIWFIVAVI